MSISLPLVTFVVQHVMRYGKSARLLKARKAANSARVTPPTMNTTSDFLFWCLGDGEASLFVLERDPSNLNGSRRKCGSHHSVAPSSVGGHSGALVADDDDDDGGGGGGRSFWIGTTALVCSRTFAHSFQFLCVVAFTI